MFAYDICTNGTWSRKSTDSWASWVHRSSFARRDGIACGGLVFKAHGLLYHPALGSSVIKKKKKNRLGENMIGFREPLKYFNDFYLKTCFNVLTTFTFTNARA